MRSPRDWRSSATRRVPSTEGPSSSLVIRNAIEPECCGWTLQFGTGASHKREVASDSESADLAYFQDAEFQFLRDCPMGDEADAKTGVDPGLDGFSGVEIHDLAEGF